MTTPHVYIAGPMRGYPYFNFDAFYAAEGDVSIRLGHGPLQPVDALFPSEQGDEPFEMPGIRSYPHLVIFNPARYDHETIGPSVNDSPTGDLKDIEGVFDLRHALGRDLAWIAEKATHIYLLDGWEKSSGARAEKALADALGLEVMYQTEPTEVDFKYNFTLPGAASVSTYRTEWVGTPPVDYGTPEWNESINKPLFPTGEVRMTSLTGGEKGKKLAELGAIDPQALLRLAEVAGFGARKYSRLNYMNGFDWSLSFDAALRHLLAFWSRQDIDDESSLPHLAHAAWQCLALLSFMERGLGNDDRVPLAGKAT